MLSSYHPFTVLAGWLSPSSPAPTPTRSGSGSSAPRGAGQRRLPPYYLPGFEPGLDADPTPESSLPEMIEDIVEAARLSLDSSEPQIVEQPPLSLELEVVESPASPSPQSAPEGGRLASETVELLHHLRRGEWRSRSSYEASLHVLSYELFSDSSGELLARTSRLVSDLETQGLVKLVASDASLSGFTCVKLRSKGRMMADRTLSPVSHQS